MRRRIVRKLPEILGAVDMADSRKHTALGSLSGCVRSGAGVSVPRCSPPTLFKLSFLPLVPRFPPPLGRYLGSTRIHPSNQRMYLYKIGSYPSSSRRACTRTGQRGGRPMSGRMRTGQVTAGPSREAAYGVALSQEVKVTDRPVTQQVQLPLLVVGRCGIVPEQSYRMCMRRL